MCGILGSGMWPLACALKELFLLNNKNIDIFGCDLKDPSSVKIKLANELNIKIFKENNKVCDLLSKINKDHKIVMIFTHAASKDHILKKFAKDNNLPICSREHALKTLSNLCENKLIVTGSCGKTTTTGILSHIINKNYNVLSIIGGGLLNHNGNSHLLQIKNPKTLFKDNIEILKNISFVAEACEAAGMQKFLHPDIGIITSIDDDHLDELKTMKNLINSMIDFANNCQKFIILNARCPNSMKLAKLIDHKKLIIINHPLSAIDSHCDINTDTNTANKTTQKSIANQKNINFINNKPVISFNLKTIQSFKSTTSFFLSCHDPFDQKKCFNSEFFLKIMGEFNALNCAFAIAASLYNFDFLEIKTIKNNLLDFLGMQRRLQVLWDFNNQIIINDYAHNPEKINSCLLSIKKAYKNCFIEAIFEPHKLSRIIARADDFAKSLKHANSILICDVYHPQSGITYKKANKKAINQKKIIENENLQLLIKKIKSHNIHGTDGCTVKKLLSFNQTRQQLSTNIDKRYFCRVIVIMGAGRSNHVCDNLLKNLPSSNKKTKQRNTKNNLKTI